MGEWETNKQGLLLSSHGEYTACLGPHNKVARDRGREGEIENGPGVLLVLQSTEGSQGFTNSHFVGEFETQEQKLKHETGKKQEPNGYLSQSKIFKPKESLELGCPGHLFSHVAGNVFIGDSCL